MASIPIEISNDGIVSEQGESGYADRLADLRAENPNMDFSGQSTVNAETIIATTQVLAVSGPTEPLTPQQQLIMEELIRAGANDLTLTQQSGYSPLATPVPSPAYVQPMPAGDGRLLPAIGSLPALDTLLAPLGSTITSTYRARTSMVIDPEWELGLNPSPGRIVFTEPANRQRSGVRLGTLPMVVWQNQPVSPFTFSTAAGGGGVLEP